MIRLLMILTLVSGTASAVTEEELKQIRRDSEAAKLLHEDYIRSLGHYTPIEHQNVELRPGIFQHTQPQPTVQSQPQNEYYGQGEVL